MRALTVLALVQANLIMAGASVAAVARSVVRARKERAKKASRSRRESIVG